ncbi:uncharacterized protein LOC143150686 [Ptiloglossa arizonensis]|uniref:uncharacterized protein LOC143150686 n=1 Tax=Ptiloglossa arizonensis TaxID=3350558 RepID=UPI003F9EE0CE
MGRATVNCVTFPIWKNGKESGRRDSGTPRGIKADITGLIGTLSINRDRRVITRSFDRIFLCIDRRRGVHFFTWLQHVRSIHISFPIENCLDACYSSVRYHATRKRVKIFFSLNLFYFLVRQALIVTIASVCSAAPSGLWAPGLVSPLVGGVGVVGPVVAPAVVAGAAVGAVKVAGPVAGPAVVTGAVAAPSAVVGSVAGPTVVSQPGVGAVVVGTGLVAPAVVAAPAAAVVAGPATSAVVAGPSTSTVVAGPVAKTTVIGASSAAVVAGAHGW